MLLPPLNTSREYVSLAEAAGLKVLHAPKDISKDVAKTWYVFLLHLTCLLQSGHSNIALIRPFESSLDATALRHTPLHLIPCRSPFFTLPTSDA